MAMFLLSVPLLSAVADLVAVFEADLDDSEWRVFESCNTRPWSFHGSRKLGHLGESIRCIGLHTRLDLCRPAGLCSHARL